jgi:hypothetical protein
MSSTNRYLAVTAFAALSVVAFATTAAATTVGGFSGHADNGSQATCVSENWNGVANNCSSSIRWNLPLAVAGNGNYQPNIDVYVNGPASNVSCTVQGVAEAGTDFSNTGWVSPAQGNVNADIVPGTVTVPTFGTLEAACVFSPGSVIHTVIW